MLKTAVVIFMVMFLLFVFVVKLPQQTKEKMLKTSAVCMRISIRTFCARTVNDSSYTNVKIKASSIGNKW